MTLSELSVRRPVFAMVLSLLLVILGLIALSRLPVREYPDIDPPIVSIETNYRGASAQVVETKITQVIEDRVAGLEGVLKLTSSSQDERSSINVEFNLARDIDGAANDIRDRVSRVLDDLPEEAETPEIAKVDSNTRAIMYINLTSDGMSNLELTDYAERVLIDRFSSVQGVARVNLSGARRYAMRIWMDRRALAGRGLTVADVESALRRENVELPAGRLESEQLEFTLRTETGLTDETGFRLLVIGRGLDGTLVRLGDVAEVRRAAENDRSIARGNGIPAISLAIEQLSRANTVEVAANVRKAIEEVMPSLPPSVRLEVNYDRSLFIDASMKEVYKALAFSLTLVLIVIYLFLGSLRATLIPALTVPVSIIATFMVMLVMGYSVNVLILLGMVLAIGLVVDDGIVVLENIYRRIEDGQPRLLAALDGSREITFAVIATTAVLVAVFVPISFIQGNVGRLFGEFGISLAAAVAISSLVALTLTPMMSSKILKGDAVRSGLPRKVDDFFQRLSQRYQGLLRHSLAHNWVVLLFSLVTCLAAVGLFKALPSEYAPKEDRGVFFAYMLAPEGATLEYTDRYARQMEAVLMQEVEAGNIMRVLIRLPGSWGSSGEVNSARAIVLLEDWSKRTESTEQIAARVRTKLASFPGVITSVNTPQGLGVRGGGQSIQMVLGGSEYEEIAGWRDQIIEMASAIPNIKGLDSDYNERKPQIRVAVDRDRSATLGVSLQNIGRTLETMLGSRIVTTYVDRGQEYRVILQGREQDRATPTDLSNLYVRSETSGRLIPLANLVTLEGRAGPNELNRFERLRSITVSGDIEGDYSLGQALNDMEAIARQVLPPTARLSWDGESREFKEAGSSLYWTFLMAAVIVYLVLAAQFESFKHPFIIMMSVPLALAGALGGLWLFDQSINVYSQIGVILLIGLAAKNGVLIVEFTNQLRDAGEEFHEAIVKAAAIRLRPVLMTSTCTIIGALPLVMSGGAGAESRIPIGIVVMFGVTTSTLLTLFVVPAFYLLMARNTKSPEHVSRLITRLRKSVDVKTEEVAQ